MSGGKTGHVISPQLPQACSRCGNVRVCGDPGRCPHGYGNKKPRAERSLFDTLSQARHEANAAEASEAKKGGRRRRATPLEQHRRGTDVLITDSRVTFVLQDSPRVEVLVAIVDWGRKGKVLEVMGVHCELQIHPLTRTHILINSDNQ